MLVLEEGIASTEGVAPDPGKGDDPIKEVLLLPMLKNDDATCVVGGLNNLNWDLLEIFPSVSTELDLSGNGETETGAAVEAAPKLKGMAEENAGKVDEIGWLVELEAANLLFDETKLTGDWGIVAGVEAANEDDNEDECNEPLLWAEVIDVPKAVVSELPDADIAGKETTPEDLCRPASGLPPLNAFEPSNWIFLSGLQKEIGNRSKKFCDKLYRTEIMSWALI